MRIQYSIGTWLKLTLTSLHNPLFPWSRPGLGLGLGLGHVDRLCPLAEVQPECLAPAQTEGSQHVMHLMKWNGMEWNGRGNGNGNGNQSGLQLESVGSLVGHANQAKISHGIPTRSYLRYRYSTVVY